MMTQGESLADADFNSIKVRLEHLCDVEKRPAGEFQFHKGAIRTCRLSAQPSPAAQFQFHKGAIRTRAVLIL